MPYKITSPAHQRAKVEKSSVAMYISEATYNASIKAWANQRKFLGRVNHIRMEQL